MIYFTGVGAKPGYLHTDSEFLAIMQTQYAHIDDTSKYSLYDWMIWAGAFYCFASGR